MLRERHPAIVDVVIDQLNWGAVSPTLRAAGAAARELAGVEGFEVPTWEALAHGLRPPTRQFEDHEPGRTRHGWQHEAAGISVLGESDVAARRTRAGPPPNAKPLAGILLSIGPSSTLTHIESHLFRVVLLLPPPSPCGSVMWPFL